MLLVVVVQCIGAYFAGAARHHAQCLGHALEDSTNRFSSIFAFWYLCEEVVLRASSSLVGSSHFFDWTVLFALYFVVALASTVGMLAVQPLSEQPQQDPSDLSNSPPTVESSSWLSRSTTALQLLVQDSKMKYMIGLNATFGFAAAFLGSYINGEVHPAVFGTSNKVGLYTAWLSIVATAMSTGFESLATRYGKGWVLMVGSVCFFWVAAPFVIWPNVEEDWTAWGLLFVYTMQGTGRATFEGTLKAVFADLFQVEKEGAFANIILQNGSASALGYALSFGLQCPEATTYCVVFRDGSLHHVLTFEVLVMVSSIVGIVGYLRASQIHEQQQRDMRDYDHLSPTRPDNNNLA